MSSYNISKIYPSDKRSNKLIDDLLTKEGIRRDANLDYTCAMFDEEMNIIATGSCYGNSLRCLAVISSHQGEGLMNDIITHLMDVQFSRGNLHLFLYTKCDSSRFFNELGFYKIAMIHNQLVFMENRRTGFSSYLNNLKKSKSEGEKIAAIVLNANPFTLGHLYLIEKAAAENDTLHLFMVSEDASLVPFDIRKQLIMEGTAHLKNICYHESGPYIISNATFPSYFQKDEASVIEGHALLDLTIFTKIAEALNITRRYVGEEPNSVVTNLYNEIMQKELPIHGIECIVIPRKIIDNEVISASTVRKALQDNDLCKLKKLVPETTYSYFVSETSDEVIQKIRDTQNIFHY